MLDAFCKSPEIGDSGVGIAVVPLGSIEQHSLHLPLGTDWILADEISRRVAGRLGAYVLPTMPFGTCAEHSRFKGTVCLRPSTFAAVVSDLVLSLYRQGFSKIAVLSGHGGNWTLKPTVRELNLSNPGLKAVWAVPFDLCHEGLKGIYPHYDEDIHAGDIETSCMMYLRPEAVGETRVDYVPQVGREFFDYVPFGKLSPAGVWGHPSLATREKGELTMQIVVEGTVKYVQDSLGEMDELAREP